MTSSQEPPLTRREIRERERLAEQQRSEAAAAQSTDAAPAPPPASQPYPQQPRVPQPATSGAPQPGGYGERPPEDRCRRGAPGPSPADRRHGEARPGPAPQQRPQQPGPPRHGAPMPRYDELPPAQRPHPGTATSSGPVPSQAQRSATTSGGLPATTSGAMPTPAPARPQPQRPSQPEVRTAAPQPAPSQLNTPERTLTRRELRAMLDAHAADGFEGDDDLDDQRRPAPDRGSAPQRPAAGESPPRSAARPEAPHRSAPHQAPIRAAAPHTTVDAGLDEPVVAPKPVGHWTSQLNLPDDREEPYDQVLSRGGSPRGVPTTTNALILPTLPDQGALGTPLAPTGEIMVTGSIDLPRSYGATGVHPSQIDSADVDRLFDSSVEDVAGPGVAPVAATRAISTQGQNRAMVAPPSKEGMNVPLVLAVTAGVLALGVVATLVVGAIAGLF